MIRNAIVLSAPTRPASCVAFLCRGYASDPALKEVRSSAPSQLKRGTGGRSSFNGHVCTIFGNTGFLGRSLVFRLGRSGTQVICPYRYAYDVSKLRPAGDLGQIIFYPFWLRDFDSLKEAVKYSNVVVNLIGRDWETKNFKYEDLYDTAPRMIARACREMGVKKFIHVSALNAEEYPQPHFFRTGSRFLSAKWRGENAVREEFPEAIIFRPADCFGVRDRFVNYWGCTMRRQFRWQPVWMSGKYTVKQPVFGSDVISGIEKAVLEDGFEGKTIDCVGPHRYLLADLVDYMNAVMRRTREDYSYHRYDMRYDPIFWTKLWLYDKIMFKCRTSGLCPDKVERECVSDVTTSDYDLRDMGVQLTCLEDRANYLFESYKVRNYLDRDLSMYDKPAPPPLYEDPNPPSLPAKLSLF